MDEWQSDLRDVLADRISTSESDRAQHGRDPGHPDAPAPEAVAYPVDTDEVVALVRICATHGKAVIPYGAGSSLEQQVSAPRGGLCIDLSRMAAVLEVNAEDMDVRVQAGVTREQLNAELRDTGLFFPIDPGANATIGGMASTRASGTNAVRYGTMRSNVLGLTVVTPEGDVVRTGSRARKSSAGYDLTALFVGAEGTLGIITEVALKLHPQPERVVAAVVAMPSLADAVDAVVLMLQYGLPLARMELLDEVQMRASIAFSKLQLPATPTLFVEFHGAPNAVAEQIERVEEIVREFGAELEWADAPEERSRLWRARHDAYWAAMALRPGARMMTTDVCVPISRLTECITATRADFDARGLVAPILGHVGDGNFHSFILYDGADEREVRSAREANDALVARALAMGGTCTGEHGVGVGKQAFLAAEHASGVPVMGRLKRALDPGSLMNPGKILHADL